MPKRPDNRKFKYRLQEEVYSFLEDNEITYRQASEPLGFKSGQALYYWIHNQNPNSTLGVIEGFEKLKELATTETITDEID